MRSTILAFCLTLSLNGFAQSAQEMRDSLSEVSRLLDKYPGNIDIRLQKAGWNLRLEQWDYALAEYDRVLQSDPKNVSALYFRAYVNERMNRYNFARMDYNNLLVIVPGHYEGRLGLALLNQKDKRYTEALDLLNALCEGTPDRSEAFAARAGIEKERGQLELAEYDYGEALRIEPDNADYRVARADLRIMLGRKDDAKEDLDELVRRGTSRTSLIEFYQRLR